MTTRLDKSLRRVAILVASLDAQSSQQVLASLGAETAGKVQRLLAELTEVDPHEQREIVADFRRSLAGSTPASRPSTGEESVGEEEAVVFEPSLAGRLAHAQYGPYGGPSAGSHSASFQSLSEAGSEFIVTMLSREHPQTIALVLSKMDSSRAAEVLCSFPEQEQTDIMARLADLDTIDEQSVRVVEVQVGQWILQENKRKRRMTAGLELVERILAKTTPTDRARLSSRLSPDHKPAEKGREAPPPVPGPAKSDQVIHARLSRDALSMPAAAVRTANPRNSVSAQFELHPAPEQPKAVDRVAEPARDTNPYAHFTAEQCAAELESLPPGTLQAALTECEPQIVTLAMVGASRKLLKLALKGISRTAARQFQQTLRDAGPMRLSDMLLAQQKVLQAAQGILGKGTGG